MKISYKFQNYHICVKVSSEDAPRNRGRKGYPTLNVVAACSFDLKFTYVLHPIQGLLRMHLQEKISL